ncbi:hypothetical protein EDM58_11905 [Brevibacillus panacihumi]|uniref:Uncharacterized protein n=1 Tax=Brevibacillus panacihumi TaxID=497735 RepID=A0A3M8CTM6_9BACL|nr:hypothetical protein EDM58_11905 [Brevibacillus panacihumi]
MPSASCGWFFNFSLKKQDNQGKLAEEKGEISEGIWDLDQAGNGKGGTRIQRPTLNDFFEVGCFWPRFRLWSGRRPGMTPSKDPTPPERSLLFPLLHYSPWTTRYKVAGFGNIMHLEVGMRI